MSMGSGEKRMPEKERLAEENYAAWCRTYEEVYGIPVRYGV